MKRIIGLIAVLIFYFTNAFAITTTLSAKDLIKVPIPTACVVGSISKIGSSSWAQYALKLTNTCGKDVEFQNSSVTYLSNTELDTIFWADLGPLDYPDNELRITSQKEGTNYKASFKLHFSTKAGTRSVLHDNESFTIRYTTLGTHIPTAITFHIDGPAPTEGELVITNVTAKPATVSVPYASVGLVLNGQTIAVVPVNWGETLSLTTLAPGVYTLQPRDIIDSEQNTFEGKIVPNVVTVVAGQKVSSTLSYTKVITTGSINIKTPPLPAQITGYTGTPIVTFKKADTGSTITKTIPWNTLATESRLDNNSLYQLSTPLITFNGATCNGAFTPAGVVSSATNPLTSQLTYQCTSVTFDKISISLKGLPCDMSAATVSFKPNDGSATISATIKIVAGSGTGTVSLVDGMVYKVTATAADGYSITYVPETLMAKPNGTEVITYQAVPVKRN